MHEFETITRDELKEKIDHGEDLLIVDTRGEDEFARAHIPGAISADMREGDILQAVAAVASETSMPIVVYSESPLDGLGMEAAYELTHAGYSNVTHFEGGLRDWAKGQYELDGSDAKEVAEQLANT